jgi:hypothetical protein
MTADIDVTVESYDPLKLLRDLIKAGFRPAVRGMKDVLDVASVIPLVHDETKLPIDVLLAGHGIEREFLARAKPADIGGASVPVIAPGDLIVAKLLGGRSKDVEDALSVVVAARATELRRAREVLARAEIALERKDLVAHLDKLVTEKPVRRRKK